MPRPDGRRRADSILTAITGYSDLLLRTLPEGSIPARAMVGEIRGAGERAAALTRQLLAFSRRQMLAPVVLALNDVVIGMARLISRLVGEDIEVRTELAPDLGLCRADLGQIEQVVMNLVVNARDAMPSGGTLTLSTRNAVLHVGDPRRDVDTHPGDYVELSVRDTGTGMDAQTRAHLFEPFFTTKEVGKGTGLGLATVYGIVKQSEGLVTAESELGLGSTFTVYLPRIEPAQVADSGPRLGARALAAAPRETVLLVEDDVPVRTLTRRLLSRAGYDVLEAIDVHDAERIAATHPGSIDLLLTDVVMPGRSGSELAARLCARRPRMRVLFISGYLDHPQVRAVRGEAELDPVRNAQLLPKPFTGEALLQAVGKALHHPAEGAEPGVVVGAGGIGTGGIGPGSLGPSGIGPRPAAGRTRRRA